MMSSMHKQAVILTVLLGSAATVGATLAPNAGLVQRAAVQTTPYPAQPQPQVQVQPQYPTTYRQAPAAVPSARVSSALARWSSLRQSDGLPFSSYASFLTSHRGWPGETSLRKTAERAINVDSTSPSEVVRYFQVHSPLTGTGHARHAFALLATGQVEQARTAAREAWFSGVLPQTDENRLLSLFGTSLTQADHDRRMEQLLANSDTTSARRVLYLTSAGRRPIYEARLALQSNASDAASRLGMIGGYASSDAGVIMDRANWLRSAGQSSAARSLLAQPRNLTTRPADAEKWFETLLVMARGAEADRNWVTAYQIASQVDDAYAPGTDIMQRSSGERDDYTSLTWLAGTIAYHRLNRPADAAAMFAKYARGGRSAQVASKGYYWAGRAAQAAGMSAQATSYFEQAARFPELFYSQLALERLGRQVPAPALVTPIQPTAAQRAAFNSKDVVEATRLLGQLGSWEDQSLFVRSLAEGANNEAERVLASELSQQIRRPDLAVWVARSARNDGSPFYARAAFPEVRIPAAQNSYWSLAHGIIRQESSFDRAAQSPVGARGMMQLMPGTAREVSGKMGLGYDLGRLTRDPEYNISLGSNYFESLMNYWGGSAPLAVASYNAGPGNVRKWIRQYGDPRLPGADIVRWIEDIPFSETRGYVQRVLENAVVYDTMHPARARTPANTRLSYYLGKSGRPG